MHSINAHLKQLVSILLPVLKLRSCFSAQDVLGVFSSSVNCVASKQVDSLLGARGGSFEHEATRRMRNEFMAAWDGLRSKENQKILILGATNRPFDLDDAVIRRLPRRYHSVIFY